MREIEGEIFGSTVGLFFCLFAFVFSTRTLHRVQKRCTVDNAAMFAKNVFEPQSCHGYTIRFVSEEMKDDPELYELV